MPAEPTILVKKSDGSMERVPLSQVTKLKAASKLSLATPLTPASKVVVPDEFSHPFEELIPAYPGSLATVAPNNAFVHPAIARPRERVMATVAKREEKKNSPSALPPKNKTANAARPDNFSISGEVQPRPVVRDVVAPETEEVGPVDEIKLMTLRDFRRLSSSPVEAATRLGQKFLNLRSESIIIYLKACRAWRESPLYREYLGAVATAINSRAKLATVLARAESGVQMAEIKSLLEMEEEYLL